MRLLVTTAVDGLDGWEKAQQQMPDLVISDVMMPRCVAMASWRRCALMSSSVVPRDLPHRQGHDG